MRKSVPYIGSILTPVQVVNLKFSEKEDILLNPFQNLILEAIEDCCSMEQIAQATLLTRHVIQTEITQLIAQKLLERRGEAVELTDLSQKILMVSRCVQRLNKEKQKVCINLMTGSVEKYDEDQFIKKGGENALELLPRIRSQEIDGISMEENIDFFRAYLHTFDGMDEEQIDAVLSSVYVEFIDTGARRFQAHPIFRLPCLISEVKENGDSEEAGIVFWVKGHMCRVVFALKSAVAEMEDSILPYLPALARCGLLSERGKKVATAYEEFQKRESVAAYYDCVSGGMQYDKPICDSDKHEADLVLPSLHELTEEEKKKIADYAHSCFSLPPELTLEVSTIEDSMYIISGDLGKLQEADNAETKVCNSIP